MPRPSTDPLGATALLGGLIEVLGVSIPGCEAAPQAEAERRSQRAALLQEGQVLVPAWWLAGCSEPAVTGGSGVQGEEDLGACFLLPRLAASHLIHCWDK